MKARMIATVFFVATVFSGHVALAVNSETLRGSSVALEFHDPLELRIVDMQGMTARLEPASPGVRENLKWVTPDILVTTPTIDEGKPAIAAAPNGDLFLAADYFSSGVRIYRSTDDGASWDILSSFVTGMTSRNPAMIYAENGTETWLVLVYEWVDSDTVRGLMSIHVDPYNPSDWSAVWIDSSIPWTVPGNELHPQITTDFPDFSSGVYYYVTYAVTGIDSYPVYFSRSIDRGDTWETPVDITGGSENTSVETRPEIAYCANNNHLYVAFNKPGWTGSEWVPQVWATANSAYGSSGSWGTPAQVTNSALDDINPSIAAAWDANTVMVAFTSVFGPDDNDVRFSYSFDTGTTWSAVQSMPSWTFDKEDNVDLAASQTTSGRFHAVYRHDLPAAGGDTWYQWADVSSPGLWSTALDVDEGSTTSGHTFYPRPAVCVNPALPLVGEVAMAWTSYQGPYYDVYFDSAGLIVALIFADGFESGGVGGWSSSVP